MMKKLLLIISLALAGFYIAPAPAQAQFDGCAPGLCGAAIASGCPTLTAAQFLARTSGLDGTHVTAYTNLINGLIADGVWSKLDILYIFATQDSATAKLNLVSGCYNLVAHGAVTFTADNGFSGVDTSATIYLATGFNPTTVAATSQLQQNAGHISEWSLTNTTNDFPAFGGLDTGPDTHYYIFPKFSDNNAYYRLNANGAGAPLVANPTPLGHYITTRSGTTIGLYRNGVNSGNQLEVSQPVIDRELYAAGVNSTGTPLGSGLLIASASIGGLLDATQSLALYNRERTYMTAVGVP